MKIINNVGVLACLCLFLLLSGGHVAEARRHRDRRRNYKLYVFGDSFVDVGNRLPTPQRMEISRQWYTPYGMSDSTHGSRPTGRFSDGLVQSDFLAQIILGRDESPPPYKRWVDEDDAGRQFAGVNFAVAGSSVYDGSDAVPSLRKQIDQLANQVRSGHIDEEDLEDSVALVAVSVMNDYVLLKSWNSDDDFRSFVNGVTDQIVEGVRRLQSLGVSKVLVNAVPPFGCTPWRSYNNNYASCDGRGNVLSGMHNAALKRKLAEFDDVLLLDLEGIFNNVISSGTDLSRQFRRKLTPCCVPTDPENGYCGQVDARGTQQYSICPNAANYLYWDFWHPTQAGWRAVMQSLEDPIKDFLGMY